VCTLPVCLRDCDFLDVVKVVTVDCKEVLQLLDVVQMVMIE
jgi:hypothetical protein